MCKNLCGFVCKYKLCGVKFSQTKQIHEKCKKLSHSKISQYTIVSSSGYGLSHINCCTVPAWLCLWTISHTRLHVAYHCPCTLLPFVQSISHFHFRFPVSMSNRLWQRPHKLLDSNLPGLLLLKWQVGIWFTCYHYIILLVAMHSAKWHVITIQVSQNLASSYTPRASQFSCLEQQFHSRPGCHRLQNLLGAFLHPCFNFSLGCSVGTLWMWHRQMLYKTHYNEPT